MNPNLFGLFTFSLLILPFVLFVYCHLSLFNNFNLLLSGTEFVHGLEGFQKIMTKGTTGATAMQEMID